MNIHDHTSFFPKAAPTSGAVTFSLTMPPSVNHCYIGIASGENLEQGSEGMDRRGFLGSENSREGPEMEEDERKMASL